MTWWQMESWSSCHHRHIHQWLADWTHRAYLRILHLECDEDDMEEHTRWTLSSVHLVTCLDSSLPFKLVLVLFQQVTVICCGLFHVEKCAVHNSCWEMDNKAVYVLYIVSYIVIYVCNYAYAHTASVCVWTFSKRMHIYKLMLEHMTDQQRFNLMFKLTVEVA